MAGIYIHIPFCKQACHYCDFHFSTSLKYKNEMLEAIRQEIKLQKQFLGGETIETIYFGGGTPSLLAADEVNRIIDTIGESFNLSPQNEITLEANPDDLTFKKIRELKGTPVNRFSMGIQSFYDEDLKWMNRAHNANEAEFSVKALQDAAFESITIDLIYGYPLLSDEKWKSNIKTTIDLEIPHLSCYSMTVEPQTALASFINKGKQKAMDETQSASQFIYLMEELTANGFEHYEISNFAKPRRHSKHNTNYWKGVKYLGIGPSAHSFDGQNRQWNVANNSHYLSALAKKEIPAEKEILSSKDKLNEYIMTSLRTKWGMSLQYIAERFGIELASRVKEEAALFFEKEWLKTNENTIYLTASGKLYADHIASELFIEDEF
jgi:oxygen-independent coproporphyrinogen-3 oxidase